MTTSRRDFIRKAALLSGVAAAPTIIPSSVFGADGGVAPSNRLSIGLVGMGKMMWGHLGGLLGRKDVQIVAISDVETIRLDKCVEKINSTYSERFGKDYKGVHVCTDFRELNARPDIDGVFIASPTHWHAIQSVDAMKNGKDVYCEKPLALTIQEAEAIKEASRRYGRIFQTGSQQRSDYKFRFACELVRNGAIGKVKIVHVNCGGPARDCYLPPQPTPETLDWNRWLGPSPVRPYHDKLCPVDDYESWPRWRDYWDYCGGGMYDFGAHHFDIAQWGLGMDGTGPVEIVPKEASEHKKLTYVYENGISMTHGGATGGGSIQFIGENGTVSVGRGFLETTPEELMKMKWGPADLRLYESRDHKGNWLDGIRTRRPCICTAETGCSTITVCALGNIAYRLKRTLKWSPSATQFLDDPAADRLLSRSMRAPWTITV
ncbi:MAG: Gfo/Idh/MocA family oxidoreductase [Lentisphaerae bacterium]|jgi:predicted dehydrogenase|nr:Gfo/Idh/MocA family oxidoreductase [Lentisphaerota bacterium]MBT5605156.1 Gfo/Idh/MocA family oxidoreductase [Lentisphaerota bacterium]MBT7848304.1 Gfo/Idh/MocA family oxidoreductase [Lentisphaerota bacterium]